MRDDEGVAGGMSKRGSYGSMAERVARARDVSDAAPEPPPVKPCWVNGGQGRLPGLLLGWRRIGEGWQGRVVHPVLDRTGWVVVEEWLDAGLLDPG